MAVAIAQNVITSLIQGVISSNLIDLASKEVGPLLDVRGDITYIIVELEMMKAFLRSAEEKQETDFMVKVWVRLIREVALDMEDCIDKFKIYLKYRPNSNFLYQLGCRIHSLCTLHVRHEIAVEIQELKNRIDHISDCRLRYGIVAMASCSSNVTGSIAPDQLDHRLGAFFVQEAQLVGIDLPRKKLIKLLMHEEQQLRVITVLGMAGLGKTTLAKRVYEDPQIAAGYFYYRAWTNVSQSFNLNVLLRDIIRQVSSPEHKVDLEKMQKKYLHKMQSKEGLDKMQSKEDLDKIQSKVDLIEKLKSLLQNKRYIIVLDDIWNIDAWESIKYALPENNNGSRVIVTTRIEEVANSCCVGAGGINYVYKLDLLSMEKSLDLFEKRVFGPNKNCPKHLVKVKNDIVVKCGGLPLAIVVMAGILASMQNLNDQQQWTNLLNNLPSALDTNPSLENMKQVLLLSYNNLPYFIKPCFLYLSIFPEDYIIKRKYLIQLWVAEGLVSNQYDMSAKVVAEYYFNELVGRSLILPSVVGWNGKVKSCRIHDVMVDVLVFKSKEENMISIISKQSRTTFRDENVIRRLSLQGESNPIRCIPDDVDLSRVRSLSIYDCQNIPALLPRLKLLRVMVFEKYTFNSNTEKDNFLQILSMLRHLRYLSLKGTHLKYSKILSKSISKLQNLVTLDIRDVGIRWLYSSVGKLRQLRHLLMGNSYYFLKMKPGVLRNLKDLQTLVGLNINNMEIAKELGYLTQLIKLEIAVKLESKNTLSFLCSSLEKLSGSLISFGLTGMYFQQERLILNITYPPSFLQSLKIGSSFKLPYWLGSLSNLTKLSLSLEQLDELEVIKTLPNLLCLTIINFSNTFVELLFSAGGFQNLKMLVIMKMHSLISIEFQMYCMPVLEKLIIGYCWSLLHVIGIGSLPCLQEIQLEQEQMGIIEGLKSQVVQDENTPKLTTINVDNNLKFPWKFWD